MKTISFLKKTCPCKDCITYPICKNELLDLLKKKDNIIETNIYSIRNYYEVIIYYNSQDCFLDKCSLYKEYLTCSYRIFEQDLETRNSICEGAYSFQSQIGSILKQVFKLESIFSNLINAKKVK